jgi:hypothetical protein
MARTVKELGAGGQRRAERELGWNRVTIRKGTRELASGFAIVDAFALRGRKRRRGACPTSSPTSRLLWTGRARPTRNSGPPACTRG